MAYSVEIVGVDAPQYGISAEAECCGLSAAFTPLVAKHLADLLLGRIDPFTRQVWRRFRGLPLIMVAMGDELMIYAAEIRSDSAVKISILFAGARTRGYDGLEGRWDGSEESLWDLVQVRCSLHFG